MYSDICDDPHSLRPTVRTTFVNGINPFLAPKDNTTENLPPEDKLKSKSQLGSEKVLEILKRNPSSCHALSDELGINTVVISSYLNNLSRLGVTKNKNGWCPIFKRIVAIHYIHDLTKLTETNQQKVIKCLKVLGVATCKDIAKSADLKPRMVSTALRLLGARKMVDNFTPTSGDKRVTQYKLAKGAT